MKELVNNMMQAGTLRTERIIQAFLNVDRADFVPDAKRIQAYEDRPLPIGFEQTISQPSTVAFMLELLDPQPGDKILDIGSGSGWQTALLSKIVGSEGKVFAVERIKNLLEFGKKNVSTSGCKNIRFLLAEEKLGWPEEAPFDKIIVAAAADHPPREIIKQLKINGRCVIPIKNSIFKIDRAGEDQFDSEKFTGFAFVPLIRY